MINKSLLHPDLQKFIVEQNTADLHKLILKGSSFPDVSIQEIVQQVEGRAKAKRKLPLWFNTPGIIYPPKLNLEQTSSALTALYKSKIINGKTLLDATGGFGIDSVYFSKVGYQVTHVEKNDALSSIACYNFKVLKEPNIDCICDDSLNHLKTSGREYDTIYIDPARRSDTKGKVFMLQDCTPNVPKNLELLLSHCTNLWIKTSPMLDIVSGLRELSKVRAIYIVAVKNEIKELIWHLSGQLESTITIFTVNLESNQTTESFTLQELQNAQAHYSLPQKYLYEPNSPLLKSGAFQWISEKYSVAKLHRHTHLYTSDALF